MDWKPITELRSVTCHMGSYSVACHPTQVNAPHLKPSHAGRYSIYRPRRGWKAELTLVLGYIPGWFTRRQTVTHRTKCVRDLFQYNNNNNCRQLTARTDNRTHLCIA